MQFEIAYWLGRKRDSGPWDIPESVSHESFHSDICDIHVGDRMWLWDRYEVGTVDISVDTLQLQNSQNSPPLIELIESRQRK